MSTPTIRTEVQEPTALLVGLYAPGNGDVFSEESKCLGSKCRGLAEKDLVKAGNLCAAGTVLYELFD